MSKEELDSIEELIIRKIQLAEVCGGLSSSDKKFISLWNYAMKLQNNWNELKKWVEEVYNEENKYNFGTEDYAYNQVLCLMQELEQGKDE